MAIVTEISWDDLLDGKTLPETPVRHIFRQAVEDVAVHAREKLPVTVNGRIDKAVAIVLSGDVQLLPDDQAKVASQSNGVTQYHLVNGTCDCKDFDNAPENWCKHRIAMGIYKRASALAKQRLESQEQATPTVVATPEPEPILPVETATTTHIPAQFLTEIHGRMFVKYEGLLALAHGKGLVNLSAHFISVSNDIALAEARAEFANGKIFAECADSTPSNVNPKVKAHFPRMALTRAKARALRDALNISMCSVEELE